MTFSARIPPPFPGFLLCVGGQCRKVGKTALVEDVIKAFPNRNWVAIKVTPYAEEGCPLNGPSCTCPPEEHTFAIRNESDGSGARDTSRFLAAGAQKAYWVQTKENRLNDALPSLSEKLAGASHLIVESDSLPKIWKPSLFLMVLDPSVPDFKISARENLPLADAFVLRSPIEPSLALLKSAGAERKPRYPLRIGSVLPEELQQFLSGSIR